MHNRRPPPNPEQPALTVDPAHLDFGEVWETDNFEWAAPVRNHTASPVQVSAYSSSCSCVAAASKAVIPSGGTTPLTFRIDLRATRCLGTEQQAVRDAKIQVALGRDTSPTEKPVGVELRGRVRSALAVSARAIDFGRFAATVTPQPRVVALRGLVALRSLDVAVEGPSVVAELKGAGPDKWELHVRPTSSVVGRHEAKVKLTPTTATGERVPAITIPVAFDVLHDIQPDSSLVPLGAGRIGETLSGMLTVSSLSGRPFPLPTCESGVATSAEPAQASHTFKIERTVAATGNHVVPVVVRGRDADGRPFELRVEVQWYGVSP